MNLRICIVALVGLATCLSAAPAGAVVGGEKIAPETVPWFAQVASCGGNAGHAGPAPDRRALRRRHGPSQVGQTLVGGAGAHDHARRAAPRLAPTNGENYLDDVAIVRSTNP